jgi:D-sedoheptulose 7-phosphate isomerase
MDFNAFFSSEFDRHQAALDATRATLMEPLARLTEACAKAVAAGGKIVLLGNGGSAADAQHLATELTIRYIEDRAPIAAIALTTDTSALTAGGNDLGFEEIFARQVAALCGANDVVIGISTSGNSENVIRALQAAKRIGAVAAGFGGGSGGRMVGLADPFLVVPTSETPRIQEMHITLGHMLCGALEKELGLI